MFHDESIGGAFFRRLAWSPDGAMAVMAAGQFKKDPLAAPVDTAWVYARGKWAAPIMHLPSPDKVDHSQYCKLVDAAPQLQEAATEILHVASTQHFQRHSGPVQRQQPRPTRGRAVSSHRPTCRGKRLLTPNISRARRPQLPGMLVVFVEGSDVCMPSQAIAPQRFCPTPSLWVSFARQCASLGATCHRQVGATGVTDPFTHALSGHCGSAFLPRALCGGQPAGGGASPSAACSSCMGGEGDTPRQPYQAALQHGLRNCNYGQRHDL